MARVLHRLPSRQPPFARASEEPYRRRVTDAVRVVLAVAAVLWLSRHSTRNSTLSLDVFHAVNGLPGNLRPVFQLVYRLAALWAVGLVVAAALAARRWRLARDLLLAGLLGWLLARGLGLVLAEGFRPGLRAVVRSRVSPNFPTVSLSLVVAVVAAAGPYLTRKVRWLGVVLATLLAPAALYLGVALPRSLMCAAVVGWGAAAAIHLLFGSPGGRPTPAQVRTALHDLGAIAVSHVELAPEQPRENTLMHATDGTARLVVKVLGRDERDAQLLAKLARFVYYKDSGPTLFLTRTQEVEHQAYVSLLASQGGVRVPPLVVAGTGGPGTVLLAERDVGGRPVSDLPAEELDDALLQDVWEQVAQLHHLRIAHGRLNTGQLVATDQGVVIVGFGQASAAAPEEARAADTAELLVTTAHLVGPDRAVRAAVAALGADAVGAALPLLQAGVLSRAARRIVGLPRRQLGERLEELRATVAAAVGTDVPELLQLQRVRGSSLALALGTVVGVGALLSAVGDPEILARETARAHPLPLLLGFALVLSTNVGFALALAGSVRQRLPLWPNVKLQAAGAFCNLALPFGSQAMQVRFLQKQGVDAATAIAGGGVVNLVAATGTQVALFFVAAQASPERIDLGQIPTGAITALLEIGTAAVVAASLLVLAVPYVRRRVLPPVHQGARSVLDVMRSPRQITLLLSGFVLAYVLYGLALSAALRAVGSSPPIWTLIAANLGVTIISALVPFPGGGAAVATVGLSGALLALGVPKSAAIGGVLLYQLISQYLPAVPGWLAFRSLLREDDL
ncbi:undecaprenyl-diphosphatase [Motilibacter rhizosphaerae]|uniref:Undecaprenyl-diphosphatase n=1 Tax=Motilibacter rhizosphaerae TaxID=598652 RepID=A0A4V2F2T0_9ACTN|nr:lysylphosphatidylglycerol synthase domain-containing protein [Motilibacter rhizosphaerae]RZS79964.1 undecaprenyl-diphosphatase [Motilibacter rhizosphaerae]